MKILTLYPLQKHYSREVNKPNYSTSILMKTTRKKLDCLHSDKAPDADNMLPKVLVELKNEIIMKCSLDSGSSLMIGELPILLLSTRKMLNLMFPIAVL